MEDGTDLERGFPEHPNLDSDAMLHVIDSYARQHEEVFGGILGRRRQTLVLRFTRDLDAHIARVRELLPGLDLEAQPVRFSSAELMRARDDIVNDMARLRADGIEVSGVGINERANRVHVVLARDQAAWRDVLNQRYGASILEFGIGRAFAV